MKVILYILIYFIIHIAASCRFDLTKMATSSSSEKPKAGDMVEFPRKQGYAHFGIFDGKGHVIHTTSASGKPMHALALINTYFFL